MSLFDNYISYGTAVFVQQPQLLEPMIATLALTADNNELDEDDLSNVCQLIHSILLHLRGHVDKVCR